MNVNETLGVIGAVTGPLGFIISLLVYFRDRAKVRVHLAFDMQGDGGQPAVAERYFVVSIYNVGRRPIYLSLAHLTIPQ